MQIPRRLQLEASGFGVSSRTSSSTLIRVLTVQLIALGTIYLPSRSYSAAVQQSDATTDRTQPTTHTFSIVGPEDERVREASIEIRGVAKNRFFELKRGKLIKRGRYGLHVQTDKKGVVAFAMDQPSLRKFQALVRQPGFGPYLAEWNIQTNADTVPKDFTMKLDRAWTVGGVVVDESRRPLAEAKVRPSFKYKNRPGDRRESYAGRQVVTAMDGSWKYESVPESLSDVSVEVTHPDHSNLVVRLARSVYETNADEEPTGMIVMRKGRTVAGKVTDKSGQPVVGATVRTKFFNDLRTATTDRVGRYELVGCKPEMARIVVSAPGKALEMKEVRVDPEMPPVDFVLDRGGIVRVRVVDEEEVGIPKARIFFQRWRGRIEYFEFDHVRQYTDENGVWEWKEAPLDEFEADICRPGGMQLTNEPMIARNEEYVFTPPRLLRVRGNVLDAETGKPVKDFLVVKGLVNKDSRIGVDWIRNEEYQSASSDGTYEVSFDRVSIAALVRAEAPGYRVADSREIQGDEGDIDIDFHLERAEPIKSKIMTPDGEPAIGSKIALGLPGAQIQIENGSIDDGGTYAKRLEVDSDGVIEFATPNEPFQLVITHDAGFGYFESDDGSIPSEIRLTPWARLEGVFRVGKTAMPNITLKSYGGLQSHRPRASIFSSHDTTTGTGGKYVFERVFPGQARVGREIVLMVGDGATEVTSSSRVSVELTAGKTTKLDLGGSGSGVFGKLVPPDGHEDRVLWNFALLRLEADLVAPPAPEAPAHVAGDREKRMKWWNEWKQTPEGIIWSSTYAMFQEDRRKSPYMTATV
ncbi:MAG: carboxypeptidase-like regulatory domain-containing protein, partial [Planctomycetota bacterium]